MGYGEVEGSQARNAC